MGRRRRSLALVVVAVVVLLVLVPAPLVLSARLPPKAGAATIRFLSRSKPQAKKILKSLLNKLARREVKDLLSRGQQDGGELNNNSADTAGVFIFNLSVGTSSPQKISGILDITSELVWSQCTPCDINASCLPPPAPAFDPNMSATFARLPCGSQMCPPVLNQACAAAEDGCSRYNITYGVGDTTSTAGYLATDTFMFNATPVAGFVFGCSDDNVGDFYGASGVLGFSRGNLSLVSQLQLPWFSYLLESDASNAGSYSQLQFSSDSVPQTLTLTDNSRSTPLLTSRLNPDLYFVKLTGIRVHGQDLVGATIPAGTFDLQANGSGGVFLSTTVPVTYLEEAAYNAVREAFLANRSMPQPVNGSALGLDLCYTIQSLQNVTVPELELVFDGASAVMKLQKYNYFFSDSSTGLDCLTILPSLGGSLLGSLLQTGTTMTYDIADAQLIFETAAQTAAAASPAHDVAASLILYLPIWVLLF